MTKEEKIRVVKLEGEVDALRKRVSSLTNGIVDTMKNTNNSTEKKNTEKISLDIIMCVRENLGVDPEDTSKDDKISMMSHNEIFDMWCEWNGFINCSEWFKRVVGNIYGINIEKRLILK